MIESCENLFVGSLIFEIHVVKIGLGCGPGIRLRAYFFAKIASPGLSFYLRTLIPLEERSSLKWAYFKSSSNFVDMSQKINGVECTRCINAKGAIKWIPTHLIRKNPKFLQQNKLEIYEVQGPGEATVEEPTAIPTQAQPSAAIEEEPSFEGSEPDEVQDIEAAAEAEEPVEEVNGRSSDEGVTAKAAIKQLRTYKTADAVLTYTEGEERASVLKEADAHISKL